MVGSRIMPSNKYSVITTAVVMVMFAGCGGGEGSQSSSTVVQTDVLVRDIDGDGRADVLTLGYELGDGRWAGRLTAYRQIDPGRFGEPEVYEVGCSP
jgi:hypothetical protein